MDILRDVPPDPHLRADTYFSSYFSGRFELKPNEDNEYRENGRLFNHLLNYLRDKDSFAASISSLTASEERARGEARFYGLFDLIDDVTVEREEDETAGMIMQQTLWCWRGTRIG